MERLGFAWTDNLGQPETKQDLEPDYVLFANDAEKEAVINQDAAHRYRAAIAILEAKKVNHPLSQISKSQQRYPHQQIRDYLNEAQVLTWGILTNGNEWRLYCRGTKPSHFFAINFELAIQSLDAFKFFVALFSPAAFVRDAQGKCRLDHVRESALAAQSELEEDLRQRIFAIVEILANGFAERAENEITDADLPRVYDASLIFLYRLLFILYAEGRQLLPVEPKSRKYYKELSLARLVTPLKNFSEHDSRTRTHLYAVILELSNLIDGTDEKKNAEYSVPRYNGGLFARERHPLLEKWRVSDAVLADVLRGLMFNPQPERDKPALPIETVDFGDLRVQQLGSIYEGLLEHHFVREGARLVLKTDKAERKATGTYYTPDYIVKYIVEQTVGPLVAEIDEREPVKKARAAGLKDNSFAHEALRLNVLDPAMGSGHFLVEATTFLADEIAAHPTTQPLGEKSKDEDEIAYWRRRVVESCIYGVDLNPLAVELAKLSLWLTTIATDQPLNFLDHHFCCGNSLVGARLKELGHVPDLKGKQDSGLKFTWKTTDNLLAAMQKAVRNVKQIEEIASDTVGDVKTKERIWSDSVRPALRPFRSVANLWLACFFGNDLPQLDYEALIELLDIHPDKIRPWKNAAEFQEITVGAITKGELKLGGRDFDKNQLKNLCAFLIRAEKSAHERRFFHWELEFPEVFFNDDGTPRESPGFDAVVGNPPYGAAITQAEKIFIRANYTTSTYNFDSFAHFFEKSVRSLSRARTSMIVPNTWLSTDDGEPLRRLLLSSGHIESILDTGNVFQDVIVDTIVVVFNRTNPKGRSVSIQRANLGKTVDERLRQIGMRDWSKPYSVAQDRFSLNPGSTIEIFALPEERLVIDKIRRSAVQLTTICELSRGARPYGLGEGTPPQTKALIEAKSFHADHKLNDTYHPLLTASEVHRYQEEPYRCWLAYGPWLAVQGEWRFFSQPRILMQRVIRLKPPRFVAVLLEQPKLNNTDVLNLILRKGHYSLHFLLALLNSRLLPWLAQKTNMNLERAAFPKINVQDAANLPIRCLDFTTPITERAAQLDMAKLLYEKSLEGGEASGALQFVEAELQAGRTDVVHDLLALLAERMMALNQEKQTTAKQFLTDLKDFHGIDTRALNPKTKLDEFWKLEADDVFAHLRKNTKLLAARNIRLSETMEENIRSRFSKAKEKLLPLEAEIAFTDRLIDQIVYRLYGLTTDEMKIVEGAN